MNRVPFDSLFSVNLIRPVYESLCELCVGLTKEDMNQPKFAGLEALSYPDLHESSIPNLAFFPLCSKILPLQSCINFEKLFKKFLLQKS